MTTDQKTHWDTIYSTKQAHEVSWTQSRPDTSIDCFESFHFPKNAAIIDVGGGDSKFVDYLIEKEYTNITVLDISEKSIERAKDRLKDKAANVHWVVSDVLDFEPTQHFDFWHDRAAFHFLTTKDQIDRYVALTESFAKNLCIGTFSVDGPKKCSGLEISQYDEESLKALFENAGFKSILCQRVDHITPAQAIQNFVFCSFTKAK